MSLAPGIHKLADAEYHADPCEEPSLSASIIKVILNQSPLHAYHAHPRLSPSYAPTVSATFDFGTVVHDLFLRGLDDTAVIIDAADWRTNAAKEARDAARAQNLIPILAKDAERVQQMVSAIRDQLAVRDDNPPLFGAGKAEQTLVWRESGVLCRARFDWLHDSLCAIDDLKTTGVSANPFDYGRRTFWSIGCDIQAAFYLRGLAAVHALNGISEITRRACKPVFRFCVVETTEPFCLSVLDLAPSALELANQKIDTALGIWKRCLETGVWPGYDQRVASVEVEWQSADFLARHWQPEEIAA